MAREAQTQAAVCGPQLLMIMLLVAMHAIHTRFVDMSTKRSATFQRTRRRFDLDRLRHCRRAHGRISADARPCGRLPLQDAIQQRESAGREGRVRVEIVLENHLKKRARDRPAVDVTESTAQLRLRQLLLYAQPLL